MKSLFTSLLVGICLISVFLPADISAAKTYNVTTESIEPQMSYPSTPKLHTKVKKIAKNGDVLLACSYFQLNRNQMDHCDIVRLSNDMLSMDIPICYVRTDVNLRASYIRPDWSTGNVYLSVNRGKFANVHKIKKGMKFTLQCIEKDGYYEQFKAHQYIISDRRNDYKSDRIFANFRAIKATGIATKTLYRSGNPLLYKESPNRSYYCAKLLKKHKIKSIINMSNNKKEIKSFFKQKPTSTSYYKRIWKKGNVFHDRFTTDISSDEYMTPVISALRFMIDAPAPYVIHCNMGKDRTGYLCALLMALTGSTYEEIVDEYMISFENYYGLKKNTKRWEIIAEGNIRTLLSQTFITNEAEKENPAPAATDFLKKYGMSDWEIATLKKRLAGK